MWHQLELQTIQSSDIENWSVLSLPEDETFHTPVAQIICFWKYIVHMSCYISSAV